VKKIFLVLLLTAGVGIWYYLSNNQVPVSEQDDLDTDNQVQQTQTTQTKDPKAITPVGKALPKQIIQKPAKIAKKPDSEETALDGFAEVLSIYNKSPISYEPLLEQLENWGLAPKIAKDSNEYTGTMAVIRTGNTLPGTRYFHAQYFSDENGENHLQHMSFEFRPGPDAFNQAIKKVRQRFSLPEKPNYQKGDFVSWNLDNGYIVWVKKMGAEDLKDDPFNAYTIEDTGTIRVAMEIEIHDGPSSHSADDHHDGEDH
jgi:hypothetical protein